MKKLKEAAAYIRRVSDLPWVDANENWGVGGASPANAVLKYDDAGWKNWKYDLKMAGRHLGRAVMGKPDSIAQITKPGTGYFRRFADHWNMAVYYVFQANELNRPDCRVNGATVYAVWVEEGIHAALWSPVLALAVADYLESAAYNDTRANLIADIVLAHRESVVASRAETE